MLQIQVNGQSRSPRVSRGLRPCLIRVAVFRLMGVLGVMLTMRVMLGMLGMLGALGILWMLGMTPIRASGDTGAGAETRDVSDAGDVGDVGDAGIYDPLIRQLPQLEPERFAGQFSSHDRSGGNNDWSDENANRPGYLYRDSYGHRVLAEAKGEGAITRLWFTGIDRVGNIRIYIDNDTTPTYDLPVRELFAGTHPPFVRPWVVDDSLSSGGFVSYVRIPFRYSFKLTTTGEPTYYHVGYEITRGGYERQEITAGQETPATGAAAAARGAAPGSADHAAGTRTITGAFVIPPGQTASLPVLSGPATITRLAFTLPDVLVVNPPITRRVHDNGRAFIGYSEFTVKIDPDNQGVRLIRRLDYGIANQKGRVYVDGELVGEWSTPGSAVGYNWRDAAFDIPADYTRGKSLLRIRVQFVSSQIDWNEFYYWVYTRTTAAGEAGDEAAGEAEHEARGKPRAEAGASDSVPGAPLLRDERGAVLILTDSIDVGYAPSEIAHDYLIVGANWYGSRDFEYPPAENKEDEARRTASLRTLSNLWLEASWDGEMTPATEAPLSLFFATPIGPHPVDSALVRVAAADAGTEAGAQLTSLWPMPFSRSAELRLHNTGSDTVRVQFTIECESSPELPQLFAQGRVGYFHATYRRESPTTPGRDYTILQVGGVGKLVGVSMRLAGPPSRWYLEGDERIRVDGSSTPVIYGTGTEDHFGGGWYFNRGPFSLPFHGAPGHTVEGEQDVTSVYRWFVPDPVYFRSGIVYTIEHGGQNDAPADYESVAFWYGLPADAWRLTDELRPADSADQALHRWQVEGTVDRQLLTSSFEGPLDREGVQDVGLYHTGRASFTVRLDPNNQGVVLRRRLDAGVGPQVATVRVNGQVVGVWSSLEKNSIHRFAESEFVLAAAVTRGRESVQVEIEPAGVWTAFLYQVYSLITPSPSGSLLSAPSPLTPFSDQTAPASPVSGTIEVTTGVADGLTELQWSASPDAFVYRIYRGDSPELKPVPWLLVAETNATRWVDPASAAGDGAYYLVQALDRYGRATSASPHSPVVYAASPGLVRIEGERLANLEAEGGPYELQAMDWVGPFWSGNQHLFFRAERPGARIEGTFEVHKGGSYEVAIYYTLAPDYGQVRLFIDGKPIGQLIDGYADRVLRSDRLILGTVTIEAGRHTVRLEVVGKSPDSTGYFAGLDLIELVRKQ
ncbi:MAG: DUF2961 domain-containing protein [Limnochordales bacterium]|nr:DUF2961 domain-containing protein [Limnochordales bacterium]